ncbi:MAG TPA: 6-phosphogluconolactonase [Candidatus Saccharimonadia bacterium]
MKFSLATTITPVADVLAETLMARLARGRVLWLLSGGSCIGVAVAAADRLRATGVNLADLTVSLIDERYGAAGHPDSNWAQLQAAGMSLPGAKLAPVLTGGTMDHTAAQFAAMFEHHLKNSYCLGLLGIGPDGHIAGIKPHSPAVTATGFVSAYDWSDYQRITATGHTLAKLDEIMVYAVGEAKWPVLDALEHRNLPAAEQPAQLIKHHPAVTIFTDRPEVV